MHGPGNTAADSAYVLENEPWNAVRGGFCASETGYYGVPGDRNR